MSTPTSEVRAIHSEMIRLAADLARGQGLPSADDTDDHAPRCYRRRYWLHQLELAHDTNKAFAIRLRALADRLSKVNA